MNVDRVRFKFVSLNLTSLQVMFGQNQPKLSSKQLHVFACLNIGKPCIQNIPQFHVFWLINSYHGKYLYSKMFSVLETTAQETKRTTLFIRRRPLSQFFYISIEMCYPIQCFLAKEVGGYCSSANPPSKFRQTCIIIKLYLTLNFYQNGQYSLRMK